MMIDVDLPMEFSREGEELYMNWTILSDIELNKEFVVEYAFGVLNLCHLSNGIDRTLFV